MVTDQRMPDLCGTELAELVRRKSPGTIRVLLTAYPGNEIVQHGLADDVQWLISKPWNDDALRLTLRHLLHDREKLPPTPVPVEPAAAIERTEPRSEPFRASWLPEGAIGLVVKVAARGVGWMAGFFGATDVAGMLPR